MNYKFHWKFAAKSLTKRALVLQQKVVHTLKAMPSVSLGSKQTNFIFESVLLVLVTGSWAIILLMLVSGLHSLFLHELLALLQWRLREKASENQVCIGSRM